jgi:hypothetical protein
MIRKTVKLYVNDPMGKRCMMNMLAADKAKEIHGVGLVVIKKGSDSDEYYTENYPPPCPSVAIGERFIVKDGTVDYEQLTAKLLKDE